MTPALRTELEFELVTRALDDTLTEARYNQILDLLLPTVAESPDAEAMLEGFGQLEWRKRRIERNHKTTAA
jgi:nucleoid DNA-binding protein